MNYDIVGTVPRTVRKDASRPLKIVISRSDRYPRSPKPLDVLRMAGRLSKPYPGAATIDHLRYHDAYKVFLVGGSYRALRRRTVHTQTSIQRTDQRPLALSLWIENSEKYSPHNLTNVVNRIFTNNQITELTVTD